MIVRVPASEIRPHDVIVREGCVPDRFPVTDAAPDSDGLDVRLRLRFPSGGERDYWYASDHYMTIERDS